MKLSDIDLTKKENQTFKNWFRVMFENGYVLWFAISLAFLIGLCCADFEEKSSYFAILIPLTACIAIIYKAFFQFWNDLCNGTSR